MSILQSIPGFSVEEAARIAREHYGLGVTARRLPSDRDQNFDLQTAAGERFVLKIANGQERREMLEAQQAALELLAVRSAPVPHVCRALDGGSLCEVAGVNEASHFVWLITFLPGRPLGELHHQPEELLEDLGRQAGRLDGWLADFDHPAIHRDFAWDLAVGMKTVTDRLALIEDLKTREWVEAVLGNFGQRTAPLLPKLRRSAIHNDLNDYNLLVETAGRVSERHRQVSGIVDFGDLVWSCTVCDLAILLAYVMLDKVDPLVVACRVVSGYHAANPLTELEVEALFGLVCLRLATSIAMAAEQHRQRPEDDYLVISQEPIRRLMPKLDAISWDYAKAAFRVACGWSAVGKGPVIADWLKGRAGSFAPVLGIDWQRDGWMVLDLGIASPMIDGDPAMNTERMLTERLEVEMKAAGARLAIGRYDESRMIYTSPLFASTASGSGGEKVTAERRTVHLGIDLFTAVGSEVRSPLPGRVVVAANNRAHLDYGPLVILEHQTDEGERFCTLYGHLSEDSLEGMVVGREVAAGEQIGSIGSSEVNGGWTPHLHFQVILDDLGRGADFPGVAPASERGVWCGLSPDPALLLGLPVERLPRPEPTKAETLAVRRRRLGGNLSIGYREPVKVLRGWRQYLFDESGRQYVDAYNNVPHVGHCHPRVIEAAIRQMRVLNTNTRYLHDLINRYAERLCATLPEPLSVCYFVNSASEANELALRLARAHTRRRDLVVLEGAYHGHTTSLIDISPYKHDGPGGEGAPDWVHTAPVPDLYRGRYRADDSRAAWRYAEQVGLIIERLEAESKGLCGYIAETCPSVGGQIFFPPGYLAEVYRQVREAGGLCIADEVQTGYGRIGTDFWAFEAHGVIPDIVVMGKPIGNGHPIGAVVTTPEVAASFNNGMEFFSTFGGNPVSCAVGLAVLDVLEDEGLQEHARQVGDRLLAGLRPLVDRFPLVGDVRGSGLFLGIELVRDRTTLTPAADEATYIANRLREEGILLGTDGPFHNVVKIRPPMPFAAGDADLLVETIARVLEEC